MMPILLAALLVDAIEISGKGRIALILPLCLAIAVVYKTLRLDDVRKVPMAVLPLWISIVVGMYATGVALWAMFRLLA